MFDMRAYVASLIAVFLALAIGILLGTVIQERAPLVDQIEKQIENLQGDFAVVREENKSLSSLVQADKAFMKKALPLLTEGKLTSRQVMVVSTGRVDRTTVKATVDALERAGADVTQMDLMRYGLDKELKRKLAGFVVSAEITADAESYDDSDDKSDDKSDEKKSDTKSDDKSDEKKSDTKSDDEKSDTKSDDEKSDDELSSGDDEEADALPGADGRRPTLSGPAAEAAKVSQVEPLHVLIAKAIFETDASPSLSDLAQLQLIKLGGPAPLEPSGIVFLVEPGEDDQVMESFLVPLAREAANTKVNVVAAESGLSLRSLMGGFDTAGITTVDNVDETIGEISLVYTVSGEKGSFGKKKGADDISPPLD